YYYDHRDPEEEGLIYIQHPWSSGTDNSPVWDDALGRIDVDKINLPAYERKDLQNPKAAAHRPTQLDYDRYVHLVDICRKANYNDEAIFETSPFLIQDPLFNSILVRSNEALIEIALLLGEDISDMIAWNELTIHSINEKLWDEERALYNAWDLRADKAIQTESHSALMPLFGGIPTVSQAERMVEVLLGKTFGASGKNFLCPSYAVNSPKINYEKYWRGPLWINMNWMLHKGLTRYLFIDEANKVKEDSLQLLGQYGFYEYFDPRKRIVESAGYGTQQFSWSAALCIDFLLNEELF
ncbi:MAG: trehalase family glycosidase, partial [Bacteroidota bacterium]